MSEKINMRKKIIRKQQMDFLANTEEFQELFVNYFMKEQLNEMIYREGASEGVVVQLNARKIFNDFIYQIIDEGKYAEEAIKGN